MAGRIAFGTYTFTPLKHTHRQYVLLKLVFFLVKVILPEGNKCAKHNLLEEKTINVYEWNKYKTCDISQNWKGLQPDLQSNLDSTVRTLAKDRTSQTGHKQQKERKIE